MIYLVIDEKKSCNLVKVGYATDIAERKKAYHTCNPMASFIDTQEGTKNDEKRYHKLLRTICKSYVGEWYDLNSTIFELVKDCGFRGLDELSGQKYPLIFLDYDSLEIGKRKSLVREICFHSQNTWHDNLQEKSWLLHFVCEWHNRN